MTALEAKTCKNLVAAIRFGPGYDSKQNIAIGEYAGSLAVKKKCPVYKPWSIDVPTEQGLPEIIHALEEDGKPLSPRKLARDIVHRAQELGAKRIWVVAAPQFRERCKRDLTCAAWKADIKIGITCCKIPSHPPKFWSDPVPSQEHSLFKKWMSLPNMLANVTPFSVLRIFTQ